jgi:type I restriction enzyme S subunit
MKFGLEQHIIDKLIAVFDQHTKVDKAIVFGSRAKGNYRPDSDIDIAIKGQDLSTDDIIAMSVAFEEKGITHKIDLINYETIKELDLKDHIDRVGIELYSRWKECKLGELTKLITKGTTPSSLGGKFINKGINYIKSEAVSYDGKIDTSTFVFIDEEMHNKLKRSQLAKDDILYSMAGVFLGKNGLVTEDMLPANTNQALAIIRLKQEIANPKFIHYYLRQKSVIDFVNNMSGQSAQPNINFEEIKAIDILLPPLPEQTAIASILSSLDDKIDLLHRQNKTLEQLAETLFRQWFVEEAEEDWEEIKLSEIAIHSKENVHPSKNPTKIYKHYSLPSFDAGKEPINEIGKEILSNKYKVISNSILVSKLNPRTPRIWMIYGNVNEDECICSTEFQIVKPKDPKWYGFIYCFLKSNEVTQELAGASSGTSGSHQRVNPQDIFNLTFLKPADTLIEEFSKSTDNYFVKINNNQTQIRTLTQTRDTLLPKLMSGEVRVKMSEL